MGIRSNPELPTRSFCAQCGSIKVESLPDAFDEAGRELNRLVWTTSPLFEPFCMQ